MPYLEKIPANAVTDTLVDLGKWAESTFFAGKGTVVAYVCLAAGIAGIIFGMVFFDQPKIPSKRSNQTPIGEIQVTVY